MYVAYTQSVEEQSISGIKLLLLRNIPPPRVRAIPKTNVVYRLELSLLTKLVGSISFSVQVSKNAVQKCM